MKSHWGKNVRTESKMSCISLNDSQMVPIVEVVIAMVVAMVMVMMMMKLKIMMLSKVVVMKLY